MAYSQQTYQKALNILEKRREKATNDAQYRFDEIAKKIPELNTIQTKLSQIGLNISRIFLFGGDKAAEVDRLMNESLKLQEEKKYLLTQNGYDEDALTIKYTCAHCEDKGFIDGRFCKCHKEILKDIERESIAKIAPIDDCTFDSFDINYYPEQVKENGISPRLKAEKIKNSCHKYSTEFSPKSSKNILFMGGTGLGKTHLSLSIANVVINKGYSVIYATAQNILSDLQNENFGKTDYIKYTERNVMSCDLLIIDDLGTEYVSSYSVACLYNIINTRLCAKLPTIISTNFSFNELENKYDQRITSRITGEYKTLILEGNDIRYIK